MYKINNTCYLLGNEKRRPGASFGVAARRALLAENVAPQGRHAVGIHGHARRVDTRLLASLQAQLVLQLAHGAVGVGHRGGNLASRLRRIPADLLQRDSVGALHRLVAHVAGAEDARHVRLQQVGLAGEVQVALLFAVAPIAQWARVRKPLAPDAKQQLEKAFIQPSVVSNEAFSVFDMSLLR